jgi:hypothetical protein
MKRYLLLVILASFVVFIGCGKKVEEKVAEKILEAQTGGKADVDISDDKMSIKTKDGEFKMDAGDDVKLPENFPSDVYVYKNAKVKMSIGGPKGNTVSFQTKDPAEKVAEKYKKEMKTKGWSQEMAMEMGEGSSLTFKKGERVAQIMMAREDESTMITVIAAALDK